MKVALIAFTGRGREQLDQVRAAWPDGQFRQYDKNEGRIGAWLAREFYACRALVFVGATGLVVRLIAGLLRSKDRDPAVLVLDEGGEFVIPLLSGHIGGANQLARDLAGRLGRRAVITTATDINGCLAIDAWAAENACLIDNPGRIKNISSALLEGRSIAFASDFPVAGPLPSGFHLAESGPLGVSVSFDDKKNPFETTLRIIPPLVTLGLGCRRGTSAEEIKRFVSAALADRGLSPKAVRRLASIDLKKDEPGLLELSASRGWPLVTFSAAELAEVSGDFHSSDRVRKITGVDNVCERAAVRDSGGRLVFGRTVGPGLTLAAAAAEWTCEFGGS